VTRRCVICGSPLEHRRAKALVCGGPCRTERARLKAILSGAERDGYSSVLGRLEAARKRTGGPYAPVLRQADGRKAA
jgi:hypothetical protein